MDTQPGDLAALLEAADEARSFHGRGVGQARQQLYDLAPDLARKVLDQHEALREVMEDHAWHDELWRFTDETEAVLAALEVPDERAG